MIVIHVFYLSVTLKGSYNMKTKKKITYKTVKQYQS